MSLMVVSCSAEFDDEYLLSNEEDYITLCLNVPGVSTRGEVADNEYESYLSHIDVVVYEYLNGAYTPFHYQRINVSNTPDGRVSIAKTKRDFKESVPYRFYVIANRLLVARTTTIIVAISSAVMPSYALSRPTSISILLVLSLVFQVRYIRRCS